MLIKWRLRLVYLKAVSFLLFYSTVKICTLCLQQYTLLISSTLKPTYKLLGHAFCMHLLAKKATLTANSINLLVLQIRICGRILPKVVFSCNAHWMFSTVSQH